MSEGVHIFVSASTRLLITHQVFKFTHQFLNYTYPHLYISQLYLLTYTWVDNNILILKLDLLSEIMCYNDFIQLFNSVRHKATYVRSVEKIKFPTVVIVHETRLLDQWLLKYKCKYMHACLYSLYANLLGNEQICFFLTIALFLKSELFKYK